MADEHERHVESAADRAFRRRFGGKDKGNKREDYALDLFREASAYLDDPERVNRILRELGKLYNPVIDAPIVDLPTRQRIMALLHNGSPVEANEILDERRRLYAPRDDSDGDSRIRSQEQWDTP